MSPDELIQRNIQRVAELEAAAQGDKTPGDLLVDTITRVYGSVTSVLIHVCAFAAWIVLNLGRDAWDPYPFGFLTFCVSLEAIILSLCILITQHRQARITDRLTHLGLQATLLTESETTQILRILADLAEKHGLPPDDVAEGLAQDADPAQMAKRPDD